MRSGVPLLVLTVLVTAPVQAQVAVLRAGDATLTASASGGHAAVRMNARPSSVDTTFAISRGTRLVIENVSGELSIEGWDRNEVEVRGSDEEASLIARSSGSTVRLRRDDRKGRSRGVEAAIRVPSWVELEISGRSLDLFVEGVDGGISVNAVSGDIWVRGTDGQVDIRTLEGEIDVSEARGGVRASSQSDEVRLRDVTGPVTVHSGSGDLTLIDVTSRALRAETQDGDIEFSGPILDDGVYGFFVHDGDAIIAIPEDSNARVSVSTFDGEFESEFPVLLERFQGGREFDFSVGRPSAHIEIQVFDGEISLLRRR